MDRLSQVEGKYMIFPSQQTTTLPIKGGGEQQQKVRRRRRKRVRQDGMSSSEGKKRRLTEEQVKFLETRFWEERKLESGRKAHLATELGIDPKQVAVWFQNRRARSKNKQLEEEYARLKADHDSTVLLNRHLESEVLSLKEQIAEAEKEIRKLSGVVSESNNGGGGEVSSRSPSTTSFSMDTSQVFHGGIGEEGEELIFINEYNNYVSMLDWSQKSGM